MKFAHIADTHIRNLKYHEEYRTVFNKIYDHLRQEKVDYIIHCGDICHTKTQISPEFVQMCSDFFKSLADIAPTYIILGNHDGNLRNLNRQDSLSPVAHTLNHHNLHLLKNSGEVVLNDDFSLNVLSVFDDDNWVAPSSKERTNIALYHGSISGCMTDSDWIMEVGENDIDIFNDFDYAMLGDIHKTNQALDDEGRIRYAGSTVQQNFGETNDKGFLVWDIENKDNFDVRHISVPNPKPFISLVLTKEGKVPKTTIPKNARLRLIVESSISSTALKKATDVAKKMFKPESVSVVNKATFKNNVNIEDNFKKENLRDPAVQEKLIQEYLEDYSPSDQLKKEIAELNKRYSSSQDEEETSRSLDFNIVKLEWDNLFNYGEGNSIDFTDFNGIVGIFGKNFSGKSSIIDTLLFTIFNSISKNSRKNLNIINNDKTEGWGKVEIRQGNKVFKIHRKSSKYLKKLKGETTVEAKTTVDFTCFDIGTGEEKSLNGLTRADTDRNISRHFGTLDDFLLTSMSSQLGALSFIEEGSTKRKEILAKFLDLNIFDKRFKEAKEDVAELKANIKFLEKTNYEKELKVLEKDLSENEIATKEKTTDCNSLREDIERVKEEISQLQVNIDSVPTEVIDIRQVRKTIKSKEGDVSSYESKSQKLIQEIEQNKDKVAKANKFIETFSVKSLEDKMKQHDELSTQLVLLKGETKNRKEELWSLKEKVNLLSEVPCGSEFSHCKFIRGAYDAKDKVDLVELALKNSEKEQEEVTNKVNEIDFAKIKSDKEKFDVFVSEVKRIESSISSSEIMIESLRSKKELAQVELKELRKQEEVYNTNKEAIEDLDAIITEKKEKQRELSIFEERAKKCEESLLSLHKSHGYFEQKIENLTSEKQRFSKLQNEYEAHDLYMKCMHPNGIAYNIIKKSLPVINGEISNILANIVDFQVYFETDDNRLDIYIQQPDRDASPLEMASGAEKTVAAMAIRLAFTNISSLPKSQLFILDEPGTALDAERMEGFIRILEITKATFKTVMLISHLDSLKDSADSILTIEKKDGYANVSA